jgi:hypothetical protein
MADSVNRIVPAPVTIDRAGQSSRDGRRKNPAPGRAPHKESVTSRNPADPDTAKNPADATEKQDPTKGKNIDVSA